MGQDLNDDPLVRFCRSLPGATADVKWGHNLIFSVGAKMFAGFDIPEGTPMSFKVDPMVFAGLTSQDGIVPAPYLARHHWVSITERGALPLETLKDLLTESHRMVAAKLPKKTQRALGLTVA